MRTIVRARSARSGARVVTGEVTAPVPVGPTAPTATNLSEIEVREVSAFMEISFRIADGARTVRGDIQNHKYAWDAL